MTQITDITDFTHFGPEIWSCKIYDKSHVCMCSFLQLIRRMRKQRQRLFLRWLFFRWVVLNRGRFVYRISWWYFGDISWHILRISWWYFCGILGKGRGCFPYNLLVCDLHAAHNIPESLFFSSRFKSFLSDFLTGRNPLLLWLF